MTIILGRKRLLKRKEGDKKKRKRAGQGETDATLSVALLLSSLNTLFVPNNLILGTWRQNTCSKVTVIRWALPPPSPPFGQFIFPYFNLLDNKEQGVWGASYLNVGRGTIEMTVNCAPLSLHVVPSMPSPTPHPSSTPLYERTAPAAEYCQQALFTRCSKPRNSAASGCCATEVGLTGGKDGGWAWRWCKYSLEGA